MSQAAADHRRRRQSLCRPGSTDPVSEGRLIPQDVRPGQAVSFLDDTAQNIPLPNTIERIRTSQRMQLRESKEGNAGWPALHVSFQATGHSALFRTSERRH